MNLIRGGHPAIYGSNMGSAIACYTETLGLSLAFRAGDHYAKIDAGDGLILGLHPAGQVSGDCVGAMKHRSFRYSHLARIS